MASDFRRSHRVHRRENGGSTIPLSNNSNSNSNSNSCNNNTNTNTKNGNKTVSSLPRRKRIPVVSSFSTLLPLLLLLLVLLAATPSTATISFIDSGRTFPSKPDPVLGRPLLNGFDYMGRLQYLSDNPMLCPGTYPNQKFQIKTPSDGIPVALVAQAGGCSIYDKLKVASGLIYPSNTVGYLIVQDRSKHHHADTDADADADADAGADTDAYHELSAMAADGDEEETYALSLDLSELNVAESNGRALIQTPTPDSKLFQMKMDYTNLGNGAIGDVNLAVMHVSYPTGQALFNELAKESQTNRHQGGTRIILNGKENSYGTRNAIVWMLITFSSCACMCACVLLCVQTNFDEEPEAQAPPRPRRRRLTFDEVRDRFPSYNFSLVGGCTTTSQQDDPHGYMELADECTICLSEFTAGDRVRKLPCGHVFRSTCIAKWLVERSATCPLCKLDLYIEPEEDNESSDNTNGNEDPQGGNRPNLSFGWDWLWNTSASAAAAGYSPLVIPSGSPDEAALLESTDENETETEEEPRSWWPFSVETAPGNDEEEHEGSGFRSSSNSPLSEAAGFLSSFARGVFGSNRRRRHRLPGNNDNETTNRLTELTEPLVPQATSSSFIAADEPPQMELRGSPSPGTAAAPPPPPTTTTTTTTAEHNAASATTTNAAEI